MLRLLRAEFPTEEIIVVANACTDGTVRLVACLAATDQNLRLIDLTARVGKGGAVRLGLQEAKGNVVAFVDADGATPPTELRRLVDQLGDADCVVASRWSKGAIVLVPQTPIRRFLGRGFNLIVRLLFGLRLADTQCGAKIFKRAAIEEIIEDVETADLAFDVDLLFQLQVRGRVIREIPTVWCDRAGSTVNVVAAAPRMLASIIRLRLFHSPCRYFIPFFDRLFGVRAIKCRRLVRILVVSRARAGEANAESVEGRLHQLLDAYRNDRREVVWWTPSGSRPIAMEYLRRHRSRFDCVVEVAPNGRRFWTPFYSLKPILMFSPNHGRLRWPYADAELLARVPEDPESFEEAVRRAMTRRDAYFLQEGDGSWTYHPRRPFLSHRAAESARAAAAASTAPASVQ
jgi:hypothetical protein